MTVIANSNFVKGCQKVVLVIFSMDKSCREVYNHLQQQQDCCSYFEFASYT